MNRRIVGNVVCCQPCTPAYNAVRVRCSNAAAPARNSATDCGFDGGGGRWGLDEITRRSNMPCVQKTDVISLSVKHRIA